MNYLKVLDILQILLSLVLTLLVLVQSKGTGLSSAFGGFGGAYRSKRGLEKSIFIATIIVSISFVTNSLLILLLA